jgi:hypothetical protein
LLGHGGQFARGLAMALLVVLFAQVALGQERQQVGN